MSRGSEWHKWDMHVHTPGSYHWNGGKTLKEMDEAEKAASLEEFTQTINDSDVSVFALQDYWNFDWYFELREYLNGQEELLKKKIFPGMELRIESPAPFRLNIHAILSDELTNQQLSDFKSALQIRWEADETKNLSDEALIDYAKRLGAGKAREQGFDDPKSLTDDQLLELGSKTAEITIESLSKAKAKMPKGKAYIMLAYDTSDGLEGLDWKNHPHLDLYFMQTADIFETRNLDNKNLFNGVKNEKNESFFEDFWKSLGEVAKPAIAGTDAHRFVDYGNYPSNKATWIKADLDFKGFEQIIYEPKDRVKIQELKPEEKSDQLIIDYVEFTNKDESEERVFLNQNLNSLIGSRAQGKSNLLKNIAYAVDPDQVLFRGIDTSDFLKLKDFKVVWSDGTTDTHDDVVKSKGILFIPQKFLGELLYGKVPKFDTFLTDLFINKEDFKSSLDSSEKLADQINLNIAATVQDLIKIRREGVTKNSTLKKLGNKDQFNKEVGELEQRTKVSGAEAKIKEEDLKLYDELTQSINLLVRTIRDNSRDITILQKLTSQEVISSEVIFEYELSAEVTKKLQDELKASDQNFKTEFLQHEIEELRKLNAQTSATLAATEKQLKPLTEKIKKHESLVSLTKRLNEIKTVVVNISTLEKELLVLRDNFIEKREELTEQYADFETVYKSLSIDLPELTFSKVNIVVSFDVQSLRDWSEENINYHNSPEFRRNSDKKHDEAVKFLASPYDWQYKPSSLSKLLKQLVDGILSTKLTLKSGKEIEFVLIDLLQNRFKIDFLKSVKNQEGVEFREMSDGEQMLSLLEMIFKFDDYNYPVLLDQPEDDLDSRAISTTVVNFVAEEKRSRQLIVATHNANLVVCGDSENVIVSQKSGGTRPDFRYISGSIENPTTNKEILEILEGGEKAFELRRKKIGKK